MLPASPGVLQSPYLLALIHSLQVLTFLPSLSLPQPFDFEQGGVGLNIFLEQKLSPGFPWAMTRWATAVNATARSRGMSKNTESTLTDRRG